MRQLRRGAGRRPSSAREIVTRIGCVVALAWVATAFVVAEGDAAGGDAPPTAGVGADDVVAADVRVLEIGPRSVPCDDVVPRRCFEARDAGEGAWTVFERPIDGFEHRDGHAFVLLVARRDDVGDGDRSGEAPATVGTERYALLHELAALPLGGATWVLERVGETAAMHDPLEHVGVAFVVRSAGTFIEGSAGCNDFSGPIAFDGAAVRIGPLATTDRRCDDDVMRQERVVLEALEGASRVTYYGDGVGFAGDTLRLRFGARLAEGRLSWTQGPSDPELRAFDERVERALEAGESWVHDPIRVALALIDSRGAPRVDIERRDDRGESPTSTRVRVDEDGFLDDSVRGVRSDVVLAPDARGAWRVLAATVTTRCWRGERSVVGPGEACP